MLWSTEVGLKVVVLSLFSDSVDGMRWILVEDSMGMSPVDVPQRHVPCYLQRPCSSTHKVSLARTLFWI
jgi:hypothetical protein